MLSKRTFVGLMACALVLFLHAGAAFAQERSEFGTLSIQARPADAQVFIDGERWVGSGDPLRIQLAPGTHRVEIRAPGHRAYAADIVIRAGETTPVNVALPVEGAVPPPTPAAGAPPRGGFEEVASEDGMAFAPEFRVADIHGDVGTLVGGSVGYVFGGQLFVGGGGYWETTSIDGWHLTYGGPIVEWRLFPRRTVGLNVRALIGGGARYSNRYFYDGPYGPYGYGTHGGRYYDGSGWYRDEAFFVAEPEARVAVRLGSFVHLQTGVGYRATSAHGLNGVSATVALQLGK